MTRDEAGFSAVRNECLDWLLILGRRHLEHVLRVYVRHYNRERPHRGLALTQPEPAKIRISPHGEVDRRDRLGGLVHEYYRSACRVPKVASCLQIADFSRCARSFGTPQFRTGCRAARVEPLPQLTDR